MKQRSLMFFFVSLLIVLQTEAKVISDTILMTPIGRVQVKMWTDYYGDGYVVNIQELTKPLPNPRDCGPFDGNSDFHLVWRRSFIPLFKESYSRLCELVNSGMLYDLRFVMKCKEHEGSDKGFSLSAQSQELEYLNLFVKELTKDARFLTILRKSAREALKESPASRPSDKLPEWAKKEIKEGRSGYDWTFLVKINKSTLDKY